MGGHGTGTVRAADAKAAAEGIHHLHTSTKMWKLTASHLLQGIVVDVLVEHVVIFNVVFLHGVSAHTERRRERAIRRQAWWLIYGS